MCEQPGTRCPLHDVVLPAPDPVRDARVKARRAADAARAGAALDRLVGATRRMLDEVLVQQHADHCDVCAHVYGTSNQHHNGDYGVSAGGDALCEHGEPARYPPLQETYPGSGIYE